MKYNPADDLLADGEYEAVVVHAEDTVAKKSGNEMLKLQLEAYREDGVAFSLDDFLMAGPKFAWKRRHFCESSHLDYERGEIDPSEIVGKNVRIKVSRQKSEQYGEQNRVDDYLPRTNGVTVARVTVPAEKDDDIPF